MREQTLESVPPGPDGVAGNADDRLIATGETLAQIRDRVLGVGVNFAPLYSAVPGYVSFSVRGGLRFGERHEVLLEFEKHRQPELSRDKLGCECSGPQPLFDEIQSALLKQLCWRRQSDSCS